MTHRNGLRVWILPPKEGCRARLAGPAPPPPALGRGVVGCSHGPFPCAKSSSVCPLPTPALCLLGPPVLCEGAGLRLPPCAGPRGPQWGELMGLRRLLPRTIFPSVPSQGQGEQPLRTHQPVPGLTPTAGAGDSLFSPEPGKCQGSVLGLKSPLHASNCPSFFSRSFPTPQRTDSSGSGSPGGSSEPPDSSPTLGTLSVCFSCRHRTPRAGPLKPQARTDPRGRRLGVRDRGVGRQGRVFLSVQVAAFSRCRPPQGHPAACLGLSFLCPVSSSLKDWSEGRGSPSGARSN